MVGIWGMTVRMDQHIHHILQPLTKDCIQTCQQLNLIKQRGSITGQGSIRGHQLIKKNSGGEDYRDLTAGLKEGFVHVDFASNILGHV